MANTKQNKLDNPVVVLADQIKKPVTGSRLVDPTIGYNYRPSTGRTKDWNPSEYNLAEIGRISDVESFARQAFNKKNALMFKEGWTFVGKNPKTIEYVKIRFNQIANATRMPTLQLFRNVGSNLIQKSNSFLIKVRDLNSSGGRTRKLPGTNRNLKPVAGYFPAPAETMEYQMTGNKLTKWRQRLPEGYNVEFDPENVVHIYTDKKDGFIFGTPLIIPAIDDIRALRKIEENIELLIYQHLFPLFQWKVGTEKAPAGLTERGDKEVDVVKREIQYLPSEGGIVTTERHEISAIGAEGRALRAESYLAHFKRRVFTGLGISAMDAGESESANRSTSETLSQNLIDGVKDYQQVVEIFINEYLIKELLLESNFMFDVLASENIVTMLFKEIDVDYQIKKENHYSDQFNKDVINLDEARMGMGREPLIVPSFDEIDNSQDDRDIYPDWYKMHWVLFDRPKTLIQATDEAYSSQGKTRSAAEVARKEEIASKEKTKTTKIKNIVSDAVLSTTYKRTKSEILNYVKDTDNLDEQFLGQLIRTSVSTAADKLHSLQVTVFRKGYSNFGSTRSDNFVNALSLYRSSLRARVDKYIDKLISDTVLTIQRNITLETTKTQILDVISKSFESFSYRTEFIEDVEIRKAYNFGQAIGMRHIGLQDFIVEAGEEACEKCLSRLSNLDTYLSNVTLDDLPPYHANCDCGMNLPETKTISVSDRREKKKNPASMADCIFRLARKIYRQENGLSKEEAESMARSMCESIVKDEMDVTKLEKDVFQVRKGLKKKYPNWSSDKIKTTAFKIYNNKLK